MTVASNEPWAALHEFEKAWQCFSPGDAPYILPGDELLLEDQSRFNTFRTLKEYTESKCFGDRKDTSLHLGLLPQPFLGSLRSSRVFILGLNPGLSPVAYFAEAIEWFRNELLKTLKMDCDRCLVLNQVFAWYGGFGYWQKKLGRIVDRLRKEWDVVYGLALDRVARSVATVELLPYHSFRFKMRPKLLEQLESVRLVKQYAHEVLVPRAENGEIMLLVTRKARIWDLPKSLLKLPNVIVYDRNEARGTPLTPNSRGGAPLLEFLRNQYRGTLAEALKPGPTEWVGEWNNA